MWCLEELHEGARNSRGSQRPVLAKSPLFHWDRGSAVGKWRKSFTQRCANEKQSTHHFEWHWWPYHPHLAPDGDRGEWSGGRSFSLLYPHQPTYSVPCPCSTLQGCTCLGGHLTSDDKENPNHDLEEEGDADEHDEGGVVLKGRPLLQHSFELRDVGHEQRHVQHALCHALLGRVVVDVHRPVDPEVRIHALGKQEVSHQHC